MPLGRRNDLGDAKYAGVEVAFAHDMEDAMQVRAHLFVFASERSPGRRLRRRRKKRSTQKNQTKNNNKKTTVLPQLRL
jgi:hypothetical protein